MREGGGKDRWSEEVKIGQIIRRKMARGGIGEGKD